MTTAFISIFLVAGVYLLWQAWRGRNELAAARRESLVATGWLLVAGTFTAWAIRHGDAGAATSVALLILVALSFLARPLAKAVLKTDASRAETGHRTTVSDADRLERGPQSSLHVAATTLVAGPVALIAALLASLSLMHLLDAMGVSESNRISAAFIAMPLLSAAAVTYAVIDDRLLRKAPVLGLVCAITGGHLALVS